MVMVIGLGFALVVLVLAWTGWRLRGALREVTRLQGALTLMTAARDHVQASVLTTEQALIEQFTQVRQNLSTLKLNRSAILEAFTQLQTTMAALRVRIDQGVLPPIIADTPVASLASGAVTEAFLQACRDVGLDAGSVTPDTDLYATGKLHEVLVKLAGATNRPVPLQRAADIVAHFGGTLDTRIVQVQTQPQPPR